MARNSSKYTLLEFKSSRSIKVDVENKLESFIDLVFTADFFEYLKKQVNKRIYRDLKTRSDKRVEKVEISNSVLY